MTREDIITSNDLYYVKSLVIKAFYERRKIMEVVHETKKTYRSIKNWYEKLERGEDIYEERKRSGRPKKVTKRVEASIRNKVADDPAITYSQLSRGLNGIKKISKSCIARYMTSVGKKYYPRKKVILIDENKRKRMDYAKLLKRIKLSNVVFSDESKFEVNEGTRKWFRFFGEPTKPRRRWNPNPSIMVWGGISCEGKMELVEIEGRINAKTYIDVLEKGLEKADRMYGKGNWSFQQDNAPAHTSKRVKKWMISKGITLINHPPNSPDMNPIESIWGIMKRKVEKEEPKTKKELREAIFKSWKSISRTTIRRTISHLKKKVCDGIIDAKGDYEVKYFKKEMNIVNIPSKILEKRVMRKKKK